MTLHVYDSLRKQKVAFKPLTGKRVRFYTCGPTVYENPHIGNYKTFLFEDVLRRYLKYMGYDVLQVMNLTDVDDKTIRESNRLGVPLRDYTKQYIDAFFTDLDKLGIERAEKYPRATDHIQEMIDLVKALEANGYTYQADGSVYFNVAKYPAYGRLSGVKRLDGDNRSRIDDDEYQRDSIRDFVLWKAKKPGEPSWPSPWGEGRPGWHIECSAMSMKYLGTFFDIHTGGVDNLFPHHENEIAQSVCATGDRFVNHWMHSEFLMVEGEKMSKSLGNTYTIRQLEEKGYSPLAFRYLIITSHYRKLLNFTFDSLRAAQEAIRRLNAFRVRVSESAAGAESDALDNLLANAQRDFEAAMDDDLNTSKAMGHVFECVRRVNVHLDETAGLGPGNQQRVMAFLKKVNRIINVIDFKQDELPAALAALIEQRQEARRNKDFKRADEIRDSLLRQGIILKDTKHGVVWQRAK